MNHQQFVKKPRMLVFLLTFLMLFSVVQYAFATQSSTQSSITLKASAKSDNITLNWTKATNSKGVLGYYVFRATKSGGQTSTPETDFWIKGTSYVDTKVVPGTTYYYIVRPVLGDKTLGSPSNEVAVYYQKNNQPITLKAKVNAGNITLEWNAITDSRGVNGYYVYRATKSGGQTNTPETDFWIKDTKYVDTKVVPGTTYYYIVKPVFGDKTLGDPSNEVEVSYQEIYGTISLTLGNKVMLVNGKLKEIDPGLGTVPVLKDARTMLPIRAIIEAMGGTIDFTSGEQRITIKYRGKTILMWIGKKTIQVNGVTKSIDVAPYYSDTGRTMIPIRFVVENLDCTVDWDGNTQTVTITYLLDENDYYPPAPPKDIPEEQLWAGTWYTDKGKLIIKQTGILVSGTYGNGKSNTIDGIIYKDNGKYKLMGNYKEKGESGFFEFVLSDDGQSFEGIYGSITKNKKNWSKWNGRREEDTFLKYLRELPSPSDFTGIWSTDIGRIHIRQSGNKVNGTLKNKATIEGIVSNNKLTGTYKQGRDTYNIEIYMLEGDKNIIGRYGTDETAKQDWKEFDGKRLTNYYVDYDKYVEGK